MRKLLLIALALVLVSGCKKKTAATGAPPAQPAASSGPSVHGPTGVVLNPGVGGGGGGAVQAVRQAVGRFVNMHELKDLQLFIENASLATGQMPSKEEITSSIQRDSPKLYKLIQDGAIVLTGTRSRENIWAYTADPQSAAGEHLIVTSSSVERMAAATLRQRLQQQGQ
jgi:hypothetical protein